MIKLSGLVRNVAFSRGLSTSHCKMSKVVDVWAQPPYRGHLEGVPEVRPLMEKSGAKIDKMMELKLGPPETKMMAEAAGVDVLFLSAWSRPGFKPVPNEVIQEYVEDSLGRFAGLGAVDLANPMKAVKEVEVCIKEYGFKGIRILPWLWNLPPNTNVYYPIYAKCIELDVPVCLQVGHTGPMCPSDPGRPIPYLDQVALHFPELKVIGGHIGYPWTDEMISLAWKYPNIYIDTSAYLPKFYPPQLLHFMNSYGAEKVMFGTNWPMLPMDKCVQQAKELPLKEENMEKFLWKNANRVFKLNLEKNDNQDNTKSKL